MVVGLRGEEEGWREEGDYMLVPRPSRRVKDTVLTENSRLEWCRWMIHHSYRHSIMQWSRQIHWRFFSGKRIMVLNDVNEFSDGPCWQCRFNAFENAGGSMKAASSVSHRNKSNYVGWSRALRSCLSQMRVSCSLTYINFCPHDGVGAQSEALKILGPSSSSLERCSGKLCQRPHRIWQTPKL